MKLSAGQKQQYQDQGFVIIPDVFSREDLVTWRTEAERLAQEGGPGVVLEENGLVRALHGCHQQSNTFADLVRHPNLLQPSRDLLGCDTYVHQFKINVKAAFGGDVWPWHQDFIFWHLEDGMPRPEVVNIAIFLDKVDAFNGPLYMLPGSHKVGMITSEANNTVEGWKANVSAKLKYTVPQKRVAELEAENGIVAATGKAGSIMLFDANLVHASVPNITPHRRELLIVTYNSVYNTLEPGESKRPEFLASRDFRALEPLELVEAMNE